jgi:hypothetical protein
MTVEELFERIEKEIQVSSENRLIKLWNFVFPPEERLDKESIGNDKLLTEEIKEIIIDEISEYSAKKLLKLYNMYTKNNISFEDFLYDDTL